jgi:hypothetical protein
MYKTTIKKNLIIFHKPHEWGEINQLIVKDFGIKMCISFVLRRELGFTVRAHQGLMPIDPAILGAPESSFYRQTHYYENQIHLDFFSDSAQSWFQLRYL